MDIDRDKLNEVRRHASENPASYEGRDFESDIEDTFLVFKRFPEKVRNVVHRQAWEEGHSAGYYDVVEQYFNLAELLEAVEDNT